MDRKVKQILLKARQPVPPVLYICYLCLTFSCKLATRDLRRSQQTDISQSDRGSQYEDILASIVPLCNLANAEVSLGVFGRHTSRYVIRLIERSFAEPPYTPTNLHTNTMHIKRCGSGLTPSKFLLQHTSCMAGIFLRAESSLFFL